MNKTPLGRTGLEVSPLGFGAAPIGFLKTDQDRVAAILNALLDSGVNVIDTAAMYEGSEELIGNAVGHRREQYVLVSKCGTRVAHAEGAPWSRELIRNTVEAALRRLRTDVIDVMLLHSCDLATLQKGEALDELVKARKSGKIRFAGYSGDNDVAAWAALQPDVFVIETSVSIVDQANIEHVLPVAEQNNVGVLAKRPIANSCWRGLGAQQGFYKQYVQPYVERFEKMRLTPAELGFASDKDWAELALRFTLSQKAVQTAIIGTTSPTNAASNIQAAEKGLLPEAAIAKLREAFTRESEGKWHGLT